MNKLVVFIKGIFRLFFPTKYNIQKDDIIDKNTPPIDISRTSETPETVLLGYCHEVVLNMNDTFAWGCADSENIASDDAEDLISFIEKYGSAAVHAYVSLKREIELNEIMHPQPPVMELIGKEKYFAVRQEISDLIDKGDGSFFSLAYFKEKQGEEITKYGEKVHWKGLSLEGIKYTLQVAYLKKAQVIGIGFTMKNALDDLYNKLKENK